MENCQIISSCGASGAKTPCPTGSFHDTTARAGTAAPQRELLPLTTQFFLATFVALARRASGFAGLKMAPFELDPQFIELGVNLAKTIV